MSESLAEALPREQARCRHILGICKQIGPAGSFLSLVIENALRRADEAVMDGDVVAMISAYNALKDIKD